MIALLFFYTEIAFLIGALGMYWACRRVTPEIRRGRWLKYLIYFVIVHVVLLCALAGRWPLPGLFLILYLLGAREMLQALSSWKSQNHGWAPLAFVVYLLIGMLAMRTLLRASGLAAAFLYLVVATFDGFSQIVGQLSGCHHLFTRISPGKTLEGLTGGIIGACLAACLLRSLADLELLPAFYLGLWIGAFSFLGDLAASIVKRRAGLKDFAHWLPGHGGVLDRFDSFFMSAAFFLTAKALS